MRFRCPGCVRSFADAVADAVRRLGGEAGRRALLPCALAGDTGGPEVSVSALPAARMLLMVSSILSTKLLTQLTQRASSPVSSLLNSSLFG